MLRSSSRQGTAAYPLAAIEFALRKVEAELGQGAVAEYATRCAQNVYAFEIQVVGLDHTKLTYKYNGRRFRLTDVSGNVIRKIIA